MIIKVNPIRAGQKVTTAVLRHLKTAKILGSETELTGLCQLQGDITDAHWFKQWRDP